MLFFALLQFVLASAHRHSAGLQDKAKCGDAPLAGLYVGCRNEVGCMLIEIGTKQGMLDLEFLIKGKDSTIKQTNLVYSLDPTRCVLVIEPRMRGEPLTVSLIDSMRVDDNDAAFAFLRRNTPRHGGDEVRASYTDSDITLFGMLLTNYNLWLQNNA